MQSKKTPTPQDSAAPRFPFLLKAIITAIVSNKAGIEEKKQLTAVFQIDARAAEMPWYALRNFLVPAFLKKELGPEGQGWKKIYEIRIEKMVNRDNPNETDGIPVRVMTFEQLESYCKKWEMPIRPREFHSIDFARQMIVLFEEDPKGYELQYANYITGKSRKYPELDNLRKTVDQSVAPELLAEMDAIDAKTPKEEIPGAGSAAPVNPNDLSQVEKELLAGPKTAPMPQVPPPARPSVSRGTGRTASRPLPPAPPTAPAPAPTPVPSQEQTPVTAGDPTPAAVPTPAADPTADPFAGM